MVAALIFLVLGSTPGCGDDAAPADAARVDAGPALDAAPRREDAGRARPDAGGPDAGPSTGDAGPGAPDAGPADAGAPPTVEARRFGTDDEDLLSSVAVAGDGTVFAAGSVRGGDLAVGPHTRGHAPMAASNVVVFAVRPDGSVPWLRRLPGISLLDTGTAPSTALAIGPDGAPWVSGPFSGAVDLGDGITRTAPRRASYVLTLDPDTGATRDTRVFGGDQLCDIHDIGLRADGGFVLGGRFSGPLDLGDGPFAATGQGSFVAAFDAGGRLSWSHGFVEAVGGRTAFDDAGGVYACAGATDATDIGDGTHDVASTYAPFVTRFDAAGVVRWATSFPGAASACYSVAATGSGATAAVFLPSGRTAPVVIADTTHPAGSNVIVGLSPDGDVSWQRAVGSPWAFARRGADADFLVTGFVEGAVDFGGGPLEHRGGFDAIAVSLDAATGAHRWSGAFGSGGHEVGKAIASNGRGGAFVVGSVQGDAAPFVTGDFGGRDLLLFEVRR